MNVETNTYRLEAADLFTGQLIEFEGGSIWDATAERSVQVPIFNFALSEIVDLVEEYGGSGDGDFYDQAVRRYFAIKRPGVLQHEDSEIEVAGLRALVRSSISNAKTPQGEGERWHLFVNIRLNDVFMQEFSADCALSVRGVYEPLFWQAIHSIRWHGDHRKAIDRQEAARAEQYARIDALTKRMENVERTASAAAGAGAGAPKPAPPEIPAFQPTSDGQPRLTLNGLPFAIDNEETAWSISKLGRDLTIKIAGSLADGAQTEQTSLIDDARWPLVIWLCLRDVYRPDGVPTTKRRFEKGRTKRATIRLEGVGYGVEFAGEATTQDGWVSLQGHLGRSYEEGPGEPLDVRIRLDPNTLDWSRYAFGTLAELDAAPSETLRFVRLDHEELATLPATVLAAPHLEELTVWRGGYSAGRMDATSTPRLEVPADLAKLSNLRELRLSNYRIDSMPDLGTLRTLTRVTIENAHLKHFPEGLLSLPHLRFVSLSGNDLTSLPTKGIECPELERITLVDNQLRDLPPELFTQPKLKSLDLRENPWHDLPDACSDERFDIGLDLDDKRRLLDFTYKGADGHGLIDWNDAAYAAEGAPKLREQLDEFCEHPELRAHRKAIRLLARRSIGFQHAEPEDYAQLGNHRFGGMPDLPAGLPYPRFGNNEAEGKSDYAYEFLAQINLDDIAPLQDYLPRRGMLYFFLTTIHNVYDGGRAAGKVLHYVPPSGDRPVSDSLASGCDCQLEARDYFEMMKPCYDGFRATAHAAISFPSMYSANQNSHLFRGEASSLRDDKSFLDDNAGELLTEPLRAQFPHQHEIAGYGFSQHEQPELQTALSQRGNPEDWLILLKVTSTGDFQWGDAGELFFVIHKSDLAKGDFSNVYCTMESS
ncbi:MAG: DUF1963 domain-containing protein [Planctomycetota bacterium]